MPAPRFLLCTITIVAFLSGRILYQLGPYWAGRRCYDATCQRYELAWLVLLGAILGIGVLSAGALSGLLGYRLVPRRKPGPTTVREALAMAAAIAATAYVSLATYRPASQYFLSGFRAFTVEHASLPEIRKWSRGLAPREPLIPSSEWPRAVSELSPKFVSVEDLDADREVSLNWGGGFMHWGITLRGDARPSGGCPRQYTLEVDELSYVWVDAQ